MITLAVSLISAVGLVLLLAGHPAANLAFVVAIVLGLVELWRESEGPRRDARARNPRRPQARRVR